MTEPIFCCYCKRRIVGETGWGCSEVIGDDAFYFHIECDEMNAEPAYV